MLIKNHYSFYYIYHICIINEYVFYDFCNLIKRQAERGTAIRNRIEGNRK